MQITSVKISKLLLNFSWINIRFYSPCLIIMKPYKPKMTLTLWYDTNDPGDILAWNFDPRRIAMGGVKRGQWWVRRINLKNWSKLVKMEKKTLSNKNGNFWKNKKSQKKLFDKIKTFLYLHPLKWYLLFLFKKSRLVSLDLYSSLYLKVFVWSVFCLSKMFSFGLSRDCLTGQHLPRRGLRSREKDEDGKDCRSIKNNPKATSSGFKAENLNFKPKPSLPSKPTGPNLRIQLTCRYNVRPITGPSSFGPDWTGNWSVNAVGGWWRVG